MQLPTLGGTLTWDTSQLYISGVLSISGTVVLPGDYNFDGTVDAADYVVWCKNNGTNNTLPNDPIGGMIGPAHYNQWCAALRRNLRRAADRRTSAGSVESSLALPNGRARTNDFLVACPLGCHNLPAASTRVFVPDRRNRAGPIELVSSTVFVDPPMPVFYICAVACPLGGDVTDVKVVLPAEAGRNSHVTTWQWTGLVVVLSAVFAVASTSVGDEWDDFHITIDPSSPTDEDTFDLRAFRWFPDSGYVHLDQSISVSGNQIDVRASSRTSTRSPIARS